MARPLQYVSEEVALATDATSLSLPPPSYAVVPLWWGGDVGGSLLSAPSVVPEFELEVWADAAASITGLELFAAHPHSFTFADLTVTATAAVRASLDLSGPSTNCDTVIEDLSYGLGGDDTTISFVADGAAPPQGVLDLSNYPAIVYRFKGGTSTVGQFEGLVAASTKIGVKTPGTAGNVLTAVGDAFAATNLANGADAKLTSVAHAKFTADGAVRLTTTGTFPAGTDGDTDYYLVKASNDDLNLALTRTAALAGGPLVQFTTNGTGTRKVVATASSARVRWSSHGLLGPLADGALEVDGQRSYWTTRPHSQRAFAYALDADAWAGGAKVSAAIYPRQDHG